MLLINVCLFIAFMLYMGHKGKAYRVEKRIAKYQKREEESRLARMQGKALTPEQIKQMQHDAKEAEYRKDLAKQGYSDELITTILPTIMNDGR